MLQVRQYLIGTSRWRVVAAGGRIRAHAFCGGVARASKLDEGLDDGCRLRG